MIPFTTCMKFNRKGISDRHALTQAATNPIAMEPPLSCSSSYIVRPVSRGKAQNKLIFRFSNGGSSAQQSIHINSTPFLDYSYSKIAERFLQHSSNWSFNPFTLDTLTGGHSLSSLLIHLFQKYEFFHIFKLDIICVWKCFRLFEDGYHDTNPFHNSVHAADVAQAMHCFIEEKKISPFLTPMEKMCSILAAVAHDLDHPGVNQHFLIATKSHLASLYNNLSVLESHHWRFAISCLKESGIFSHFTLDKWQKVRDLLCSLIMATDISQQHIYLKRFRESLDSPLGIDMRNPSNRLFVMQIALKCADLSNSGRPWPLSVRWTRQICDEFYQQGDYERYMNMEITPMCDRQTASMAKIQTDFLPEIVAPLFELWDQFLCSKLSRQIVFNLRFNVAHWMSNLHEIHVKRRHSHESSREKRRKPRDISKSLDDIMSIEEISLEEIRRNIPIKHGKDHEQEFRVGKKKCTQPNGCETPTPPPSPNASAERLFSLVAVKNQQQSKPVQSQHSIPRVNVKLDQGCEGHNYSDKVSNLPHSLSSISGHSSAYTSKLTTHSLFDNNPQISRGRRGSAPECMGVYSNCELAAALVLLHGAVSETETALRTSISLQKAPPPTSTSFTLSSSSSSLSSSLKAQKRRSSFPVCNSLPNGSFGLVQPVNGKENPPTSSIYGVENTPRFKGRSLELLMSSLAAKSKLLNNHSCSLDSSQCAEWIHREERRGSIPQDILIDSLASYTAAEGL